MTAAQLIEYRESVSRMKANAQAQRNAEAAASIPPGTFLRRTITPSRGRFCFYCGRASNGRLTCRAHADLPALDPHWGDVPDQWASA